ncbi:MAG: FAD-dependent oxidoreductase, partial [Rhodospirillales bacterium]|nr:FAD-dependent oxidoreductase [Rhodospirillales bacterium]
MAEPFIRVRKDGFEETIQQFSTRRFGAEFTERVMDPLVGGIYAGQAADLSISAAFPQLLALEREHGSVMRGVIHRKRQGGKMPSSRLFSWRTGMASLPASLSSGLGGAVKTGMVVRAIHEA